MSHFLRIAFFSIFLGLFSFVTATAQTTWSFVALTAEGTIYFIDRDYSRLPNGHLQVWQKTLDSADEYTIALGEWNCTKKTFRLVQTVVYRDDRIIYQNDEPSAWRYLIPGSTGMLLYLNICGEDNQANKKREDKQKETTNKRKVEKSASSFAQITVRNAALMSEADPKSEVIRKVSIGEKLTLVSEKPVGVWYRVLDPKTNSEGWLNGYHFKIVKAVKPTRSTRKTKSGGRKRRN